MTVLTPVFNVLVVSRTPALLKVISVLSIFNARLTGLISVSELKHAVTVTASKSVMAFRGLLMTTDLSRLTTGTMDVNADHKEHQKLVLYI